MSRTDADDEGLDSTPRPDDPLGSTRSDPLVPNLDDDRVLSNDRLNGKGEPGGGGGGFRSWTFPRSTLSSSSSSNSKTSTVVDPSKTHGRSSSIAPSKQSNRAGRQGGGGGQHNKLDPSSSSSTHDDLLRHRTAFSIAHDQHKVHDPIESSSFSSSPSNPRSRLFNDNVPPLPPRVVPGTPDLSLPLLDPSPIRETSWDSFRPPSTTIPFPRDDNKGRRPSSFTATPSTLSHSPTRSVTIPRKLTTTMTTTTKQRGGGRGPWVLERVRNKGWIERVYSVLFVASLVWFGLSLAGAGIGSGGGPGGSVLIVGSHGREGVSKAGGGGGERQGQQPQANSLEREEGEGGEEEEVTADVYRVERGGRIMIDTSHDRGQEWVRASPDDPRLDDANVHHVHDAPPDSALFPHSDEQVDDDAFHREHVENRPRIVRGGRWTRLEEEEDEDEDGTEEGGTRRRDDDDVNDPEGGRELGRERLHHLHHEGMEEHDLLDDDDDDDDDDEKDDNDDDGHEADHDDAASSDGAESDQDELVDDSISIDRDWKGNRIPPSHGSLGTSSSNGEKRVNLDGVDDEDDDEGSGREQIGDAESSLRALEELWRDGVRGGGGGAGDGTNEREGPAGDAEEGRAEEFDPDLEEVNDPSPLALDDDDDDDEGHGGTTTRSREETEEEEQGEGDEEERLSSEEVDLQEWANRYRRAGDREGLERLRREREEIGRWARERKKEEDEKVAEETTGRRMKRSVAGGGGGDEGGEEQGNRNDEEKRRKREQRLR